MLTLGQKKEPQKIVLREASGEDPEAFIMMAPVSGAMRRRAQRSARKLIGATTDINEIDADLLIDAVEVNSRELIRLGAIEWSGIGDAAGTAAALTPDRDTRFASANDPERPTGTIDQLLDDDEYFGILDKLYVTPDALRFVEKNASSASPSGTGEAATRDNATASSAAGSKAPVARRRKAPPEPPAASDARSVRTPRKRSAPKRGKASGTS